MNSQMESNLPKISVIVPVYLVEAYFDRCLSCLRNQTFPDIEIILVDDGSPDRCPEWCDRAALEDARVRVIHQKNQGLSAARNTGIRAARGAWLMFADSDDAVRPEFCEKALQMVESSGADIGCFGFFMYGFYGEMTVDGNGSVPGGLYPSEEALNHLASGKVKDYAWNKIYRRELFRGIQYPVGERWEDIGTTFLLFDAAKSVYISHYILYDYYRRPDSLSFYPFREITADYLKQREKEYLFLVKHHPEAARAMYWLITGIELDYCMYRCFEWKNEKFRQIRRRMRERRATIKGIGWKMWIKVKCLLLSRTLFYLITAGRRRKMADG